MGKTEKTYQESLQCVGSVSVPELDLGGEGEVTTHHTTDIVGGLGSMMLGSVTGEEPNNLHCSGGVGRRERSLTPIEKNSRTFCP